MADGSVETRCVLVVHSGHLDQKSRQGIQQLAAGRHVLLLPIGCTGPVRGVVDAWTLLRIKELLDRDRLHAEYLEFLQQWPRQRLPDGRTFDERFRLPTGDSLWWTGPGAARHPLTGPTFPCLRGVWLVREACQRHHPDELLYHTRDGRMARLLEDWAQSSGVTAHRLPGSARPKRLSNTSRWLWLLGTCLTLGLLPCWILLRSWFTRLVTGARRMKVDPRPAVVLTGWFPNHVRDEQGRPAVAYWSALRQELNRELPECAVRYLLHTTKYRFSGWRRVIRPFYTGWGTLRAMPEVLPLSHCHPELMSYLRAVPAQWRLMRRLVDCENSPEFCSALRFAGTDVSCLIVPLLRRAVGDIAKWSRNVAAVKVSLQQAGHVRAVLVHEEFYPKGLLTIAAARELGIPTIGVQHGTIGPEHTMYMPPRDQVLGAPLPDLFAAYGAFARDVLCGVGQFPRERVRIVGAPRFDGLVRSLLSRDAVRTRLGYRVDETIVLLASEGFALSQPIVLGLLEIARAQPDWRIVIKLHPNDRHPEAYTKLRAAAGVRNVDISRHPFPELLVACDVLVTGASTTGLEALLSGRRFVSANFTAEPDRYPYVAEGAALGARNILELHAAIASLLTTTADPALQRRFLLRHLGPTVDGHAGRALVDLLREVGSREISIRRARCA